MVVERVASILHVVYFTLRHRRIRGEYEHANGFVRIKLKCGYRFVTDGQEHDLSNNWKGSFKLDDVYMNTAAELTTTRTALMIGAITTSDFLRTAAFLFSGRT